MVKARKEGNVLAFLFLSVFSFNAFSQEAQPSPAPLQLKNGSFEQGIEQWRMVWTGARGAATIKQEGAFEGWKYLDIAVTSPQKSRLMLRSQEVQVAPGKTYELKFNYYTREIKGSGGSVRILAYDQKKSFIGYFSGFEMPPTANVWVTEEKKFVAPENCSYVILEFNFSKAAAGEELECRLDNVRFSPVSELAQQEELAAVRLPLFHELLIEGTAPKQPRPMPYWGYDVSDPAHFRTVALRWGHEYVLADRLKELGQRRWAPFDGNGRNAGLRRQNAVPSTYYIYAAGHFMDEAFELATKRGAQATVGKQPFPTDPIYIDAVVELLKSKKTLLGRTPHSTDDFVMFVDELYGKLTHFVPVEKRTSEFWKSADETVRTRYGFGKYGMPVSDSDKDAFRRIAYWRWQSDLAVEAMTKIGSALREVAPGVRFMGTDEYASPTPLDWERIGAHVDIQLGQTLATVDGWRKYNPGYIAKFMRDLSGKPTYPFLQVIKYGTSPSPDTVHGWVDQALQGGASGLFVGAVEWFDRDLNHPLYAAPEKWRAYTGLVEQVQRLPQIRYPADADVALHYSSFANMANIDQRRFGAAYALLGPRAGVWFTVTDDFQVNRDQKKWHPYKVVVAPDSIYVSQENLQAMQEFAEHGGTLILSDPQSLSWLINGEQPTEARRSLQGASFDEPALQRVVLWNGEKFSNPTGLGRKVIERDENTRVLAEFADGSPAILEHRLGKGRVVSFLFDPHADNFVDDTQWCALWQGMIKEFGVQTDRDIWRFSLPKSQPQARPQDECVTGNAVWMQQNKPDFSLNRALPGTYWYDTPPQAIPDVASVQNGISFESGKLTNRVAMANAPKTDRGSPSLEADKGIEKWVVQFGSQETSSRTLTFQLQQEVELTRANLVFSGALPATTVAVSRDGKNWQEVGRLEAQDSGADVFSREARLGGRGQYVRFTFASRPANTTLTLSEVELWAAKTK